MLRVRLPEVQNLPFMMKCVNRERGASERVTTSSHIRHSIQHIPISRVHKITRVQDKVVKKLLYSTLIGRRLISRPRTRRRNYVQDLTWTRLGIPPEYLPFVAEDRDAWRPQLEQLPLRPPRISGSRRVSQLVA